MNNQLPTDLHEFAKYAVWYDCPERFIKTEQAYKDFLVHLLAYSPDSYIEHAKKTFKITDEDFRDALKTSKPGVFMFENEWLYCNERLGINPPLPYPRKVWSS